MLELFIYLFTGRQTQMQQNIDALQNILMSEKKSTTIMSVNSK